jgi:hypothetical protein
MRTRTARENREDVKSEYLDRLNVGYVYLCISCAGNTLDLKCDIRSRLACKEAKAASNTFGGYFPPLGDDHKLSLRQVFASLGGAVLFRIDVI